MEGFSFRIPAFEYNPPLLIRVAHKKIFVLTCQRSVSKYIFLKCSYLKLRRQSLDVKSPQTLDLDKKKNAYLIFGQAFFLEPVFKIINGNDLTAWLSVR